MFWQRIKIKTSTVLSFTYLKFVSQIYLLKLLLGNWEKGEKVEYIINMIRLDGLKSQQKACDGYIFVLLRTVMLQWSNVGYIH